MPAAADLAPAKANSLDQARPAASDWMPNGSSRAPRNSLRELSVIGSLEGQLVVGQIDEVRGLTLP